MLDDLNKKMEAQNNYPSDFYKMVEGANRMRILTDFVEVRSKNDGKKFEGLSSFTDQEEKKWIDGGALNDKGYPVRRISTQGWAWAIIRNAKDGDELKIVKFGSTILGQLVALRHNVEYAFDTMPMPYDITVNATGAGTKEVEYTVTPARQNTDVTEAEMAKLNKKKTIATIVQAIKDKQDGKTPVKTETEADKSFAKVDYPAEEINAEDIPF